MSKPIIVVYHCSFFYRDRYKGLPDGLRQEAVEIVRSQMAQMAGYGLYDAARTIVFGVNGGDECIDICKELCPKKARLVLHGPKAKYETPTIVLLEEEAKRNPDSYICYFHNKGATHTDQEYLKFVRRWVKCMMDNLVVNWKRCVADLDAGFESVGCHWMEKVGVPPEDNIWGGNFWWAKAEYLRTLPPIMERPLIKQHGPLEDIARFEPERWIGTGPRLPRIRDYHVNGIGACP